MSVLIIAPRGTIDVPPRRHGAGATGRGQVRQASSSCRLLRRCTGGPCGGPPGSAHPTGGQARMPASVHRPSACGRRHRRRTDHRWSDRCMSAQSYPALAPGSLAPAHRRRMLPSLARRPDPSCGPCTARATRPGARSRRLCRRPHRPGPPARSVDHRVGLALATVRSWRRSLSLLEWGLIDPERDGRVGAATTVLGGTAGRGTALARERIGRTTASETILGGGGTCSQPRPDCPSSRDDPATGPGDGSGEPEAPPTRLLNCSTTV